MTRHPIDQRPSYHRERNHSLGELIKFLGELPIRGRKFRVELNQSSFAEGAREVHIQNEEFRLSVPETEFLRMAACVLLAAKHLRLIKEKGTGAE